MLVQKTLKYIIFEFIIFKGLGFLPERSDTVGVGVLQPFIESSISKIYVVNIKN